jgi:chromosomal replication initiator protein
VEGPPLETDANALWQQALEDLARHVSRPNYETFLQGTEGLRLEADALVIGTPTEFVTAWLQKRIRPLVIRTLTDIAERPLDIRFEPLRAADESALALRAVATEPPPPRRPRLRDAYRFSTFVVTAANQQAFAAAEACTAEPGGLYNPLVIFGGSGLGKTHLLHAIGHRLVEARLHVVAVSAEQFTSDFTSAIQQRTGEDFRARYRQPDALLLDDIQFVIGKERTQEELLHTVDKLYEAGRQIVLTADRSPPELQGLDDRLRTRLEWGMVAKLEVPDLESRIAILRHKASERSTTISDEALHAIASRTTGNVGELEGALTRVTAHARLTGEPIDSALVHTALVSMGTQEPRLPASPELIIEVVCRYFDIETDGLISASRKKQVAYPRQVAMYLMREITRRTLAEIGGFLGGRDHSTVHHGWDKLSTALSIDLDARRDINNLRELIEQARHSA